MRLLEALISWLLSLFTAPWRRAWRAARRRALSFEREEALLAAAPGRRITVDGVRLHYIDRGRGAALLLIHGLGASTFTWRENIDELASTFRVVAVDLLGFGYSQQLADVDYSLSAHAARIAHLMDALGIERAVVVGHSLGGAVAQHLAARYPARLQALVLISSATPRETRFFALSRFLSFMSPFYFAHFYHDSRRRRRVFRQLYYDPSHVSDDVVAGYLRPSRFRGHQDALARLARDMAGEPAPDLDAIRAPVRVLWGERDRIVRNARGRWLARKLHVPLTVVPRSGHLVPEERADAVNSAILVFARVLSSPQIQPSSTA